MRVARRSSSTPKAAQRSSATAPLDASHNPATPRRHFHPCYSRTYFCLYSVLLEIWHDLRGCCARSKGGAVAEPFWATIGFIMRQKWFPTFHPGNAFYTNIIKYEIIFFLPNKKGTSMIYKFSPQEKSRFVEAMRTAMAFPFIDQPSLSESHV